MKNRIAQNHIKALVSSRGVMLQLEKGIEEEILQFYKQLLGTDNASMHAIQPDIMTEGPILTRS